MGLKMFEDLTNSSEFVSFSFRQYKETVAGNLGRKWDRLGGANELSGDGGKMAEHVSAVIDLMDFELTKDRELLHEAAQKHHLETGPDKSALTERDEAAADLSARYIRSRDLYVLTYGEDAAVATGFELETSRTPHRLRRQVSFLLEALPKIEVPELPDEDLMTTKALDHKQIIADLSGPYKRLDKVLNGIGKERRAAEMTGIGKRVAMTRHARRFIIVARCGEMLYLLADMPEEAAKIRPSGVRPGRRAVEVEGDDDLPPDTSDTEAPSDEPTVPEGDTSPEPEDTDTSEPSTDNP